MLTSTYIPAIGQNFVFQSRDTMMRRPAAHDVALRMPLGIAVPSVSLPIDNSGNQKVSCPIDYNDQYGICGPAMCAHDINIATFGRGLPGWTEWQPDLKKLLNQYLKVSGGDNGTDEEMLVGPNGIFVAPNGLAGDPTAIVWDSLDIDVTDVALTQFALANGFLVNMAWSVPNAFISGFSTGSRWPNAMRPNPRNGHYSPLVDVGSDGFYTLYTWGGYGWVSNDFIGSVQPQCFVAFCPRSFQTSTGLDSYGRHVRDQAALWVACGGRPIPESLLATFPPKGPAPIPTPTPTPTPTPIPTPTPTPTPTPVTARTFLADWGAQSVTVGSGITLTTTSIFQPSKLIFNDDRGTLAVPSGWTVKGPSGQSKPHPSEFDDGQYTM